MFHFWPMLYLGLATAYLLPQGAGPVARLPLLSWATGAVGFYPFNAS